MPAPPTIWPPAAAFVDNQIDLYGYPVGAPEFSDGDIPLTTVKNVFTEEWQAPWTYPALPLNTKHWSTGLNPDHSDYILVKEGPRRDIGGGQVRWTRTYALVPSSYSLFSSMTYSFIGFYGSWGPNVLIPQGRNRTPLEVQTRIQTDFFLIDAATGTDAGPVFKTPGAIPVITAQKYRIIAPYGTTWWTDVDWVSDAPPFTLATVPSRTAYNGYQANASNFAWASGTIVYNWAQAGAAPIYNTSGTQTNPGQIAALDSTMDLWMGNIWLRRSVYVMAQ